jgi:hypothetical protein
MKIYDLGRHDGPHKITWIAEVEDLVKAEEMMRTKAAEAPGDYFVYDESRVCMVRRLRNLPFQETR